MELTHLNGYDFACSCTYSGFPTMSRLSVQYVDDMRGVHLPTGKLAHALKCDALSKASGIVPSLVR